MAEVQILDGEAFEDAATTPAWKKVRGIVGKAPSSGLKNQPVAFDQWRSWMGELANGLDELEKVGLAHGDPYPFNAICTGAGATWVDFGHLTNDPAQHFKDAWAFVLFHSPVHPRQEQSIQSGLDEKSSRGVGCCRATWKI